MEVKPSVFSLTRKMDGKDWWLEDPSDVQEWPIRQKIKPIEKKEIVLILHLLVRGLSLNLVLILHRITKHARDY